MFVSSFVPGLPVLNRLSGLALGLWAGFSPLAQAQTSGLDSPQAVGSYFNGIFPVTAPGLATGWATENAFPNLTFVDPIWLTPIPGGNDLLLVGKNGQLWRFAKNAAVTQAQVVKVLEWVANTQSSEDQGFYSLVFHPQFGVSGSPNTNYAYVCYNHKPALTSADSNRSYWRVSRFTWLPASGTLDPTSESVLINQYDRCRWHNGGAMFFDNQGFLNITCGDGGDSAEGGGLAGADGALSRTQKLNFGLFSGVFRIDVNNDPTKSHAIRRQPQSPTNKPAGWPASSTQGYGIPNDNPWLDPAGSILEEYHSLGLRSPHTAHYDAVNGEIWIGDVGEGSREEITRLPKGGNAQWGYREGTINGPGTAATPAIGVDTPPVLDYARSVGTCIIGGMRYRGAKWNALLGGKVLYGDHVRGRIWTATLDAAGGSPVSELIIDGFPTGNKAGLGNFCTDAAGEVYLMTVNGTNLAGGTIRKLVASGISTEPPQFLSQTGVFTNLATLATAPCVIPYHVANPLWSDASAKSRWIILPNDGSHNTAAEKIVFDEEGSWTFPAGTVFVKHFEVATNENNPAQVKRLETRFLVCTAGGGKYGFTYRWNPAGTDAELLASGAGEDFSVTLQNGSTTTRHWDYPSRADCMLCHTTAAGQALGVKTASLNGSFHYPSTGRSANQLATFNALGMFDRTLTTTELENFIEGRAISDETAPIEHRVRSYLDNNCAHCHRPGGTIDYFDARLGTPLNVQGLINGMLKGHFDLGTDGRYLKPGSTSLSALHLRMANVGNGAAMPPLAKNLVDQKAVDLLQEYLLSLNESEFQTTASPTARYVRITATSEVNAGPWTSIAEFSVLDGSGAAIPTSELSVQAYDSQETVDEATPATNAIDGNTATFWHTEYGTYIAPIPHYLTINLGSLREVGGFVYTPRQNGPNGRIGNYQVHCSTDGTNWTLMTSGTWANDAVVKRYDGLVGRRKARCQIGGPTAPVAGAFDVTVVFDMDVTDFTAADLQVSGGTVSKLRGKGYYYVASISPNQSDVTVAVPADVANSSGLGSRASSSLSVGFIDVLPPVPVFTSVPAQVTGPFQLGLSFGETVSGLDASDFNLTNARLDSIAPSGNGYLLSITPLTQGTIGIEIKGTSVIDTAGLTMGAGTSVTTQFLQQILARNAAEYSYLGGGMVLVTDAAAPHGKYLWLPDAAYAGNFNLPVKTQHRAEYTFVVPQAGQWLLKGLIRSPDASSDSFFVEVDGNQALGTVYLWDTLPVASAGYTWDNLSNRTPFTDPVTLTLSAGTHTITVYARDDGTRLDRLELESVRPLASLSTTSASVNGPFTAALTFSESVTGLVAGDFSITGGTIQSVSGSGASYSVVVQPSASIVVLTLPENRVVDAGGAGNFVSNPLSVTYRTAFQQWAFDRGVSDSVASQLSDEDGDGINKLLEYAFNLDPSVSSATIYDPGSMPGAGLPKMILTPGTPDGCQLSLQYLRRKGISGLTYKAQFGSSPADFADAVGTPTVESVDATWERVTISDPAGAGPVGRFGRVRVTWEP